MKRCAFPRPPVCGRRVRAAIEQAAAAERRAAPARPGSSTRAGSRRRSRSRVVVCFFENSAVARRRSPARGPHREPRALADGRAPHRRRLDRSAHGQAVVRRQARLRSAGQRPPRNLASRCSADAWISSMAVPPPRSSMDGRSTSSISSSGPRKRRPRQNSKPPSATATTSCNGRTAK